MTGQQKKNRDLPQGDTSGLWVAGPLHSKLFDNDNNLFSLIVHVFTSKFVDKVMYGKLYIQTITIP